MSKIWYGTEDEYQDDSLEGMAEQAINGYEIGQQVTVSRYLELEDIECRYAIGVNGTPTFLPINPIPKDDASTVIATLQAQNAKQSEVISRMRDALELYVKSGYGNSTDFYKQAEAHGVAEALLAELDKEVTK